MTTAAIMPATQPIVVRGRTLAIGFATAVAMWVVAYIAMMKAGLVMGEVLFGFTLLCLIAGGIVAGRTLAPGESPTVVGLKVGLTTAAVNVLLIGSLLGSETTGSMASRAFAWGLGNFVVSSLLVALGTMLGAKRRASTIAIATRPWFFVFTCVSAITVFLLLITGGLVTGLEAGLAVPDWPNSFGHNMLLYPLSEMTGGVYYEHAHRLYGMLVGVTAIALVIGAFMFDQRSWLRVLAVVYLLMVCAQGVLGGTRVAATSVPLAIGHGVFGQIVFATACALAAFTSPTWRGAGPPRTSQAAATDRAWSAALVIALLLQLGLGATYRHTLHVHVLYTHILVAVAVLSMVVFVAGRAWGGAAGVPILPRLGKAMLHTTGLQILLGVVSMIAVWSRPSLAPTGSGESTPIETIPLWEVVFTTSHQATGALLLALATLLTLWTHRLLRPDQSAPIA